MKLLLDSFWRAAAYCLLPRVMVLSLLPLVLMVALSFGLGYFFWESTVAKVAAWVEGYSLIQTFLGWLDGVGMGGLSAVLAPLLVLIMATPVIVVLCLLLVAIAMTPSMVGMVERRRFPGLERKQGGSFWSSLFWSLGSTAMALLALVVSVPLWLIPPLILLLPPLIWGWLTYRVFAFDVLAVHASAEERRTLMRKHRGSLLLMGVVSGYMGAAPTVLWASGAVAIALAPLLVPIAIWIYTLVFAFASLWFSHFALAVLAQERGKTGIELLDPLQPELGKATTAQLPNQDERAAPSPAASKIERKELSE